MEEGVNLKQVIKLANLNNRKKKDGGGRGRKPQGPAD